MNCTALMVIPQPKELDLTFVKIAQRNRNILVREERAREYSERVKNLRMKDHKRKSRIEDLVCNILTSIAILIIICGTNLIVSML